MSLIFLAPLILNVAVLVIFVALTRVIFCVSFVSPAVSHVLDRVELSHLLKLNTKKL